MVKCCCLLSPGGATGAAGGSRGQLPADWWTLTPLLLPLLATGAPVVSVPGFSAHSASQLLPSEPLQLCDCGRERS